MTKLVTKLFLAMMLIAWVAMAQSPILNFDVEEEDGSPQVFNPYALKFSNGTVTDNTDGTVSVSNTGISGGGSITDNAIPRGDGGGSLLQDSTALIGDTGILTIRDSATPSQGLLISPATAGLIIFSTISDDTLFFSESMVFADNEVFSLGTGISDAYLKWDTDGGTHDFLQLALRMGATDYSGYLTIIDQVDDNAANRAPGGTATDPTVRIYSGDVAQANDYLDLYHDQDGATVESGNGDLIFKSSTDSVRFEISATPTLDTDGDFAIDSTVDYDHDAFTDDLIVYQSSNTSVDMFVPAIRTSVVEDAEWPAKSFILYDTVSGQFTLGKLGGSFGANQSEGAQGFTLWMGDPDYAWPKSSTQLQYSIASQTLYVDQFLAFQDALSPTDPTSAASISHLYTKDTASVSELFFMDDTGSTTQLTSAGGINGAALKADSVDSAAYAATSVDPEHVASGAWDFGTSVEADTLTEGGVAVPNEQQVAGMTSTKVKIIFAIDIVDPAAADHIDIKVKFPQAMTVTAVYGICVGGTNVVGGLYEVDSDGLDSDKVQLDSGDYTVTTTQLSDTSITVNSTLDANDWLQWDTTSVSGSVTMFSLTVWGYET